MSINAPIKIRKREEKPETKHDLTHTQCISPIILNNKNSAIYNNNKNSHIYKYISYTKYTDAIQMLYKER